MLVSLLMAELGVHSVAYAFPKVKIITTAVDQSLDDFLHVIPGIGEILHTVHVHTVHVQQVFCVNYKALTAEVPVWAQVSCEGALAPPAANIQAVQTGDER